MEEFSFYTFGTQDYFDTLNRFQGTSFYVDLLKSLLPPDWEVGRFDTWVQASSRQTVMKPQGFKIHVSSTVENAPTILRRVVPECVRANVKFKIAADPILHRFLNSKRFSRGGSGKFVTIYPPDEGTFRTLIEALHQATKDLDGPYILSDQRYRDSKVVFYRYGGFQRMLELRPDGLRIPLIQKPDGTYLRDDRTPYFQLPDWVKDPFEAENEAQREAEGDLLHGRYSVQEALAFTNTGGVYRAIDTTTGRVVVIKEARPHTEVWMGSELTIDATMALRLEHENLRRLQGLACVPELIDFYQEWEHTFLVVSFCEGTPLARLRANEEVIVMSHIDEPERVLRFCTLWRNLALRLLDAVEAIHARGLIVGDISPGNVLLNRDTGEICIIDFEAALKQGEVSPFSAQWFNPGFRKPERSHAVTLEPFDDFYACGMLLYNFICPVQNLFQFDTKHPVFRILDHFIEGGMPTQTRDIIQLLLEGKAAEARQALEAWNPAKHQGLPARPPPPLSPSVGESASP